MSGDLSKTDKFRLLMESATDYAIFFTDLNGLVTEWNSGAERLLGFTEEEILGKSSFVIFTPEDQEAGDPVGEQKAALEHGQAADERWHIRKDGSRFWGSGRLVSLKDGEGKVLGFAKILRDYTQQIKAQEELRLAEERLRLALAASDVGIWEYDIGTGNRHWDEKTRAMFGISSEVEVTPDLFCSLIHPEDRELVKGAIGNLVKRHGDSGYTKSYRVIRPDGTIRWVMSRATVERNSDGTARRIVGSLIDITEPKLTKEQLEKQVQKRTIDLIEKTKQLESFCYTVAHDLRAPLRAIHGYAELIELEFGSVIGEVGQAYVGRIRGAAKRLDNLIQDLLGYNRVEQTPLNREPVNLEEVLQWVLTEMEEEIRKKNGSVEYEEPLPAVCGDRIVLHHVFLNLVSNSIKFSKAGIPPIVRIRTKREGEQVKVIVEDNGIGIPEQYLPRIFRMFERIHPEESFEGTGVGLAIVQKGVERMGGSVGVESVAGEGSKFWVTLDAPKGSTPQGGE